MVKKQTTKASNTLLVGRDENANTVYMRPAAQAAISPQHVCTYVRMHIPSGIRMYTEADRGTHPLFQFI